MLDVLPREFRHVHQAIHAAQGRRKPRNARLRTPPRVLTSPGFRLFRKFSLCSLCSSASHSRRLSTTLFAILVELDDLSLDLLPDVRLEFAHPPLLDQ